MIRRFLPALAALGLLPALVAVGSATSTADAGTTSDGTAVAAGTVTAASGQAMPGLTVDLYAWPSNAAVNALKPGSTVPLTLLAATTTDSTGAYTLRVPAAQLSAAATEDGWANLEIVSPGGGLWFFSYPAGPQAGQSAATVTVDLGNGKKKHPWPCGYAAKGVAYGAVGPTYLRKRAPVWASVGQGYIVKSSKTSGDNITFEYTKGSSHEQASHLGVGLSGYGLNAGYVSEGTNMSTASRAEGYHTQFENAVFQTEFQPGQYRFLCITPGLPGQYPVHRVKQHAPCPKTWQGTYAVPVHMCLWMVRSTGWVGGSQALNPKHSPSTPREWCLPHQPGDSFSGDFGTAVTWSAGWELGADLNLKGVNLKLDFNGSAQTGYDQNDHMKFQFGKNHGGYLCGTNAYEAHAAQLVMRSDKAPA